MKLVVAEALRSVADARGVSVHCRLTGHHGIILALLSTCVAAD